MKKSIIFLVCCLGAASIHPAKRQGDNPDNQKQKRRKVQGPGSQQGAALAIIYSLPLDILIIILKNALSQATTRAGYVRYVQQYSKLQQVCKLWNNLLQRKECAYLNPLKTPYAKNLIAHKDDSHIDTREKPLHKAVKYDHIADVIILIQGGANVNAQAVQGWTPLLDAALYGHTEIAKLLIENGADVNAQDKWGQAPLHEVASLGYTEIVKLLIENGADVNVQNKYGKTSLHYAAQSGSTKVVKVLIEKGAEIEAQNQEGKTPLDCAKNKEIANLLLAEIEKESKSYDKLIAWLNQLGT